MLEKLFKLKERNTNVQTEVMAGITTFMTMAYILFVNPSILGSAGMDKNAVLLATALGASAVTIMMGLFVNYPIALAPGMGLNAFYAFTVVIGMGVSWQVALGAVFISGIIFIILTVTQVRQLLIEGMPNSLKHAITVGIGLFITIIGLKMSGIMTIRLSLIPPTMEKIIAAHGNGTPMFFETIMELGKIAQKEVLLAVFGLIFISILTARNVKGSMLIGIVTSTLVGIGMGIVKVPAGFSPVAIPDFTRNAFFALDIPAATFYSYKLIRNGIFTHFVQIKCKSMITKLLFCFINTITDFLFNIRFIFESLSINKSIRHFICTLIEFDA